MTLELTREDSQIKLANDYTTRGALVNVVKIPFELRIFYQSWIYLKIKLGYRREIFDNYFLVRVLQNLNSDLVSLFIGISTLVDYLMPDGLLLEGQ